MENLHKISWFSVGAREINNCKSHLYTQFGIYCTGLLIFMIVMRNSNKATYKLNIRKYEH